MSIKGDNVTYMVVSEIVDPFRGSPQQGLEFVGLYIGPPYVGKFPSYIVVHHTGLVEHSGYE